MNEYNEFISQQTVPPYGGQPTSEWSAPVEDERPAPPQDTAPAPEELVASAEEPEPIADEAPLVQEATPDTGSQADAEAQAAGEAGLDAEQQADAEAPIADEGEPGAEPQADAETPITEEGDPEPEPQAVEEAPGADNASEAGAPADLTAGHLIDPGDAERFNDGWREVKAAFVDDPADAVRQASALVGEAVDEVTTALTRLRQNLDEWSRDTGQADTERLRQVLRGYGSLLTHILTR